jgi:hypothetical protein
MADPITGTHICVSAWYVGGTYQSVVQPLERNYAGWNEVIFASNSGKFGNERNIQPKSRQCFQKATETLRGRVQNTVLRLGIIETPTERAISASQCPVRQLPQIGPASNPKQRTGGVDRGENLMLPPGKLGPHRESGAPPGRDPPPA